MIDVNVFRDKCGFIKRITIKGHAGYAEHGSDIVCAAVSVTGYTAAGALGDLAGIKAAHREKDGFMVISIPDAITEKQNEVAQIILETTVIGLKQIEMEYATYIKVLDREV